MYASFNLHLDREPDAKVTVRLEDLSSQPYVVVHAGDATLFMSPVQALALRDALSAAVLSEGLELAEVTASDDSFPVTDWESARDR